MIFVIYHSYKQYMGFSSTLLFIALQISIFHLIDAGILVPNALDTWNYYKVWGAETAPRPSNPNNNTSAHPTKENN